MSDFIPPIIARIVGDNLGLKATLADSEAGIASFGNKASGLGAVMGKVGGATVAAAAGIAVASVKMAGDFQASMTRLVTSAGEVPKNMKLVSDGILNLAVKTGTSTKQLADGMYMVESAGFHGAQGLKVLQAAAEGARAEQAPLADVANAVTSALKSYGLGAGSAVQITNEMVAAVGHGKTTMSDFAGSLSTVLPKAAAAKIGFDQIAGAISTMTNHGTSAREATLELANTINALLNPSNVAVNEMQQLGINSTQVAQNLGKKGLTGTLEYLSETVLQKMGPSGLILLNSFNQSKAAAADANEMISKMPASLQTLAREYQNGKITATDWTKAVKALPADQANLAKQFAVTENKANGFNQQLKNGTPAAQTYNAAMAKIMGGTTGLNTTLMLTGSSMDTFKSNVAAIGAAGRKTGKDVQGWQEIQKTFNFQLSQLKEVAEKAGIQLGTKLIPPLMSAMKWVKDNTGTVKDLAEAIGVFLAASVTVFAAQKAVAMVKGVVSIGKAAKDGVVGVKHFADGIRGVEGVAGNAAKAGAMFRNIASGAKTAATAVAGLTKNIVLQGVAVAKTVVAWVAQKVAVVASAIAEKAAAVAQWILNIAMDANPIGLIILAIAALIAIVILVVTHWKQVSKFFSGLWKDIKAIFWDAVHGIGSAISAVVKWVEGLPKKAGAAFGKFVGFVKALPGNVLKGIEALPKIFDNGLKKLGTIIGTALGWIVKQWIELPVKIWHVITSLWDTGLKLWEQGATKVVNWVKSLPGKIEAIFKEIWQRDVAVAKRIWTDVYNFFVQGGQSVLNWLTSLPGKIEKFAVDTYNGVTGWVSKMWTDLYNDFMNGLNKAVTFVQSMPGRITKFFTDLYNGAVAEVKKLWGDVVSFFTSLPGKAVSVISGLPGQIGKIWNTLISDAQNFGKWIINGLLNGLKSLASTVTKWISDFAGSIGSSFMKELGIGSPSKIFHQFGQFIGQGLINGMKGMNNAVGQQAKQLAGAAAAGFGSPTLQVAATGTGFVGGGGVPMGISPATVQGSSAASNSGTVAELVDALRNAKIELTTNLNGKTVAKVLYPDLVALVQQHKNRNSVKSGTMLS